VIMKRRREALRVGLVLFSFALVFNSLAQEVEHNYELGPQQTNCDSLKLEASDLEQAIEMIKSAKFRYQQSFKLTRRAGFKGGDFYSCDNHSGYLMIRYHDSAFWYKQVTLEFWKIMISSSDPEGYYLENKQKLEEL